MCNKGVALINNGFILVSIATPCVQTTDLHQRTVGLSTQECPNETISFVLAISETSYTIWVKKGANRQRRLVAPCSINALPFKTNGWSDQVSRTLIPRTGISLVRAHDGRWLKCRLATRRPVQSTTEILYKFNQINIWLDVYYHGVWLIVEEKCWGYFLCRSLAANWNEVNLLFRYYRRDDLPKQRANHLTKHYFSLPCYFSSCLKLPQDS